MIRLGSSGKCSIFFEDKDCQNRSGTLAFSENLMDPDYL